MSNDTNNPEVRRMLLHSTMRFIAGTDSLIRAYNAKFGASDLYAKQAEMAMGSATRPNNNLFSNSQYSSYYSNEAAAEATPNKVPETKSLENNLASIHPIEDAALRRQTNDQSSNTVDTSVSPEDNETLAAIRSIKEAAEKAAQLARPINEHLVGDDVKKAA